MCALVAPCVRVCVWPRADIRRAHAELRVVDHTAQVTDQVVACARGILRTRRRAHANARVHKNTTRQQNRARRALFPLEQLEQTRTNKLLSRCGGSGQSNVINRRLKSQTSSARFLGNFCARASVHAHATRHCITLEQLAQKWRKKEASARGGIISIPVTTRNTLHVSASLA